jgi:phenylpyruvate tautomerase PptA (4-oxalocrotonate tautomerase family)
MPLVRVSIKTGRTSNEKRAIADSIYEAMRQTINIPENDRFVVISEHADDGLISDPNYMGISRSENPLFVEITFRQGRTVEMKQALYKKIVENLVESVGVRKEDVLIVLRENDKADWSFGNGEAQYVT